MAACQWSSCKGPFCEGRVPGVDLQVIPTGSEFGDVGCEVQADRPFVETRCRNAWPTVRRSHGLPGSGVARCEADCSSVN